MNPSPSFALPLLALLLLPRIEPLHASGPRSTAEPVPRPTYHALKRGAPTAAVHASLGPPDLVLPPATWVYWNVASNKPEAIRHGYDTLLLKFEDDRAIEARFVNGVQLRAVLDAHSLKVPLVAATP